MLVGRVLIRNGFHNGDDECFLLGCELVSGQIEKGNKLVIDNENKCLIQDVETPIKEFPLSIILSIRKENLDKKNIAALYDNEYCLEK